MLGLAIHTSSPQLGLMLQGVEADSAESRHQVWDLGREVSSQLHVKMMEFLAPHSWQDLSFVAVAIGPGGFTGTRIGVVAARTLAQQLNIPLFGVSSLAALAQPLVKKAAVQSLGQSSNTPSDIIVTIPAKRDSVYGAIYRPDGEDIQVVREVEVISQTDWEKVVAQKKQANSDITEIKTLSGAGVADSVTGVMALALARWQAGKRPDWASVMPFYGQHPVHR